MTIFTGGLRESSDIGIHELPRTLGDTIAASAAEAWEHLPTVSMFRIGELSAARGERPPTIPTMEGFVQEPRIEPEPRADVADVPIDQARAQVLEAGLGKTLTLPDAPSIKAPALEIMLERARHRRELEVSLSRGPSGFIPGALSIGTSFLVSAIDPINVASAFIPVIGEARYAKLLAEAGTSAVARAGVRAGVGAASGAAGAALVEPIEAYARTQEGADYTMASALQSVLFGAALGGALHSGGGAAADALRARRGEAAYPFGEGEPFEAAPAPGGGAPVRPLASGGSDAAAGAPDAMGGPLAGAGTPDPAEGFVRFYHGGNVAQDVADGYGRWVTPHLDYARGYAGKSGERGRVYFVDIPEDSPLLFKAYDDTGADRPAPYIHFEAPPDIAKDLRPYEPPLAGVNPVTAALDDLPPRAREDAMRASIAAVVDGEPVRTADLLAASARGEPRMASLSAAARDWPELPQGAAFAGNTDHGPVIEGLQGRWAEAVAWLRQAQAGDARGVLVHPDVPGGRIDVIWGEPDRPDREGYGLAHILGKHPEVDDSLPEVLASMRKVGEFGQRVQLETPDRRWRAAVRTDWNGERKIWLLTAFRRGGDTGESGGPGGQPGFMPATDLRTPLSRHYDGEGAGPPSTLAGVGPEVDAAWRELSSHRREFDEPEVLEASAAAARLAEPGAIAPEATARIQAAERAAAEAEAEFKAHADYLPEDLKERVEQELAAIDAEAKDREHVLKEGAACLAAAVE